jgi:hypothetical protein
VNLRRVRSLAPAEAAAVAGLGLVAAGVAGVADALVQAAPTSDLDTADRLAYGLWTLRLEHGLAFTLGLGLFCGGLAAGARLQGWRDGAARVTAGLAYGLAALAGAVLVASTYVALRGHVGSGFVAVHLSGRARVLTWLRQAVTAAGFGAAWVLAGVQLGRPAVESPPLEPATLSPDRLEAREAAVTVPGTLQAGGALSRRARDTYRNRLAYSRRGDEARALVERVERLEQEGRTADAERALSELEAL